MPSRSHSPRINNHRLCPNANDILKQVQILRRQSGRGKTALRALNDEAVVGYFAEELKTRKEEPAGNAPKQKKKVAA